MKDRTSDANFSLSDTPSSSRAKPFSLLARPSKPPDPEPAILDTEEAIVDEGEEIGNETVGPAASEDERGHSIVRSREDRLRQDLFVLRKLNEGFSLYKNALSDTKSSTEASLHYIFAYFYLAYLLYQLLSLLLNNLNKPMHS